MRRRWLVAASVLVPCLSASVTRAEDPPAATPTAPQAAVPTTPAPTTIDIHDVLLEPVPRVRRELASFHEALDLIASRSIDLMVAKQDVERAEALSRQAMALALPQIDGKVTGQLDLIRGDQTTVDFSTLSLKTITVPPTPTALGTVAAVQPVYAPRIWSAMETARKSVVAADLTLTDRRRSLVIAAANAVVAVVTAERVSEVNRIGLRSALERLELTSRKLRAGTGTALDVVRARQDETIARATLIQGDEALMRARDALGLALGFAEPFGVTPKISLDELGRSAEAACTTGAIDQRADVLAAKAQAEVSERQVGEAKLAYSPTVNAVSTITGSSEALANTHHYAWNIQGVVTIPIYDGGNRKGAVRAAQAASEQARARVEGALRGATVDATQALRAVRVAEQAREQSIRGRELAAETARLATAAFEAGTGTSFDLVDSGRRLREAESDLALREFDVVKARLGALLATSTCRY